MKSKKNYSKVLIDKMFEIAGHDSRYEDIVDRKDNWYYDWSMTKAQCDEWIAFGIDYLIKKAKMTKVTATFKMNYFAGNYGLIVKD